MIYEIVSHTNRRARTISWLTSKLVCSEKELRAAIANGQKQGFLTRVVGQEVFTKLAIGEGALVHVGKATPGRHHIAQVTDTHTGSSHFAKKALNTFLKFAWGEGVRSIGFTGDGTDGVKALLVPEQRLTGADEQIDELVQAFRPFGFGIAAIPGNHDVYTGDAIGLDIGHLIQERMRDAGVDWTNAGTCRGNAVIEGARTHLWHPMGAASTPNAIRRMLNSHAERLQEPTDLILSGHLHHYATCHAAYEDIFCAAGGCFQVKKSAFANRISGPWDIGATIISFSVDKRGRASEFSSRFYPMVQS